MIKDKNKKNVYTEQIYKKNIENDNGPNDFYKDINILSFKLSLKRLNSFYTSKNDKNKIHMQ